MPEVRSPQTSCRGQLTCSRCASVGHSSTDCTLEQKCVNCTQSHPSDSKLCQKWKIEKQIKNLKPIETYLIFEARRLIVPQLTQTILPTIQSESLLQIPIPTTTTTSPGNNLNTLVSPLETETRSRTPPAKLHSVSTENLHQSVPNESNSEHSTAAETQQIIKRKSRNRRKRTKIQKPDIDIQRVPHKSRHATPTEITTDEEDMITYDVEEEELEQDPFILPKGYLRALTPSRYRNYRE
ncbi:hypothetical protein TNCV_1093071 [Trichonephila clavipes]|nr:hypothetical protein TNCV_1093071 [Trichonephila clavipes]